MPGAPVCFVMTPVEGDPKNEASIIEMKGKAGCSVPLHWHPARERIMMVSGTAVSTVNQKQTAALKAGDYLSVPPQTPMTFRCDTACTLFVHTDGAFVMHYVDEAGKEISPEEALKPVHKAAKKK
jgi:quercetin dioxygenase-like cupin family protein